MTSQIRPNSPGYNGYVNKDTEVKKTGKEGLKTHEGLHHVDPSIAERMQKIGVKNLQLDKMDTWGWGNAPVNELRGMINTALEAKPELKKKLTANEMKLLKSGPEGGLARLQKGIHNDDNIKLDIHEYDPNFTGANSSNQTKTAYNIYSKILDKLIAPK